MITHNLQLLYGPQVMGGCPSPGPMRQKPSNYPPEKEISGYSSMFKSPNLFVPNANLL
jgi:hypothetical protein